MRLTEEQTTELVRNLKTGDVFYTDQVSYMGKKTYKNHIVSIVEHAGYKVYTTAWYGKHKQYWHYEAYSEYSLFTKFLVGLFRKERIDNEETI